MCRWIRTELGAETPLHFSRFYPIYKLTGLPPTPVSILENARKIATEEGLCFVYIGSVPGHEAEHTFCPQCKRAVIERRGYRIVSQHLKDGLCEYCKQKISGIWNR